MLHAGIDMHKKFSVATVVDDAGEEWHLGELFPRVGFIVTNMSSSTGRGYRALDSPPTG